MDGVTRGSGVAAAKALGAVATAKTLARKSRRKKPAAHVPLSYLYHVGKGNNSRLVLASLRKRPWFLPAPADAGSQRVFAWEMYR